MKIALILGGSGLVGSHIIDLLLEDSRYAEIRTLGRKALPRTHPKLKQFIGDLFFMQDLLEAFIGIDDLFIAIGTTQAKTPDRKIYEAIDFGIPLNAATHAAKAGVKNVSVVSSMGANAKSRIFYSSLKGRMEVEISKLDIPNLNFVRPSLLLGHRPESRAGEKIGANLMVTLDFFIPKNYKAISGQTVAAAMVALANKEHTKSIWVNSELFTLANLKHV